jgi:hypothetical protein
MRSPHLGGQRKIGSYFVGFSGGALFDPRFCAGVSASLLLGVFLTVLMSDF